VLAVLSINSRVIEGLTCNLYLVYVYVKEQKRVCVEASQKYCPSQHGIQSQRRRRLYPSDVRRRGFVPVTCGGRRSDGEGGVQWSEVQRSSPGVGIARRSKAQWSGTGKQGVGGGKQSEVHEEPALRVVN
jgi:hypothetical protein